MRVKKQLFLSLVTVLFIFFNQSNLPVHAVSRKVKTNKTRQLQKNGTIVCVDVADFFYEIVLGFTTFPEQGDCTDKEEEEIVKFLQKGINTELRAIPGTLKTNNKVCSDAINDRRRLLAPSANESVSLTKISSQSPRYAGDERILTLHTGRRAFIYVGGGRCRFCFVDNFDHRVLSSPIAVLDRLTTTKTRAFTNNYFKGNHKKYRRNLLHSHVLYNPERPVPKVADASLCPDAVAFQFLFEPNSKRSYRESINWINLKTSKLPLKNKDKYSHLYQDVIGLYNPGSSFGVNADLNLATIMKYERFKKRRDGPWIKVPIKSGTFHFQLHVFDLPKDSANDAFGGIVDSLVVFVNGIKLDFNLLMAQPGVERKKLRNTDYLRGTSFAGIRWFMRPLRDKDFALGPQIDRVYHILISAPLIVLSHKNQLDVDFLIKPNAKAKSYAFQNLAVDFEVAQCEVAGLENSPFEDFQSVVESRLFHKLGMNLALEFQGKKGHCLYDKIPVVNVHLVEKESWKESKPQCR